MHEYLKKYNEVVRILILKTSGSAPRNSGTWMIVWKNGQNRTIGGGQLEYEVTKIARDLLNSSHSQKIKKYSFLYFLNLAASSEPPVAVPLV